MVLVVALNNLANATVQKNDTVEQLGISNLSLSASFVARDTNISRLLTIIANLSTGGGGGGRSGGGINNGKFTGSPWDPIGYYWTHGFKVCVLHSTATCNKCKDGHNAHLTAKWGDIQGGYEWNRT